jgi:hyperosmotically inducible protein
MRIAGSLIAAAFLAGCSLYAAPVSVVSGTYGVAADQRAVATQAADAEVEAEIRAALLDGPVDGTGSIDVFARRGVVVLAGVVPPDSPAGPAAVSIACAITGVERVETVFVAQASGGDRELEEKIRAALVSDSDAKVSGIDIGVYGGHVVLVGVVDSETQVAALVGDARGVDGVLSVRSYLQLSS